MPKLIDLVGQVFSNWTVLERLPSRKGHTYYKCQCKCGTIKPIEQSGLTAGMSKSCGCLPNPGRTTHGKVGTKAYIAWQNMIARCSNPKTPRYKHYGAKGISVCKPWHLFENFYADMGDPPNERDTLDRINNLGDYKPSNCRWAPYATQNRNYARNKNITFRGKTMCIMDWSKETDIHHRTLYHRLGHLGWSVERALTTPSQKLERSDDDLPSWSIPRLNLHSD